MRLHVNICVIAVLVVTGLSASASCQSTKTSAASTAGAKFDTVVADAKAMMLIDPTKTVERAQVAEQLATELEGHRRAIALATAQWLQGEGHLRLNEPNRAAPLIDRAIRIIGHVGPPSKLKGDLLLSRGGLRTSTAHVAGALDDYQKAHNIFRMIGETRSRAIALMSIALLYQEAEDYQNALKYYSQSMDVYRGDPQILYAIYNNRANALKELGQVGAAEEQLRQALQIARSQNSPAMEARVLSNIARGQLMSGQLIAADRTIALGFKIARGDDAAVARGQFWVLAANAAYRKGQMSDAVKLIDRSFRGIDPSNTTLEMREAHKAAYDIFKKVGDERQALLHLEALKRLDDQTSTLASSANTALAAARFDFANQELRISKLKADELQRNIDFERARTQTRQKIAAGIAGVVLLIVGMLTFGIITLRRSRDAVRAANVDLASTNDKLGKALAAKTEFLATTSHEIRTPLNGILGMTQVMLADDALTESVRERVGVVHGAGVTMRALVDDILDVAKMETGNLTIEHVVFDLVATLTDVSRMWREQADGRGIDFVIDLADAPTWIEGDPSRLRQIVFNLLSNALKFTERGSVTLSARGVQGRLLIAVADSGIGIPEDKHDIIFESFRQVDAGTTRRFGGTGLGLSICRNLARAMQGDVRVESATGEGTTFTIDLPLIIAAAPTATVAGEQADALMILDRNPITRSMLRALLEDRAGCVIFAADAIDATEKLQHRSIATVLIDDTSVKDTPDVIATLSNIVEAARSAEAETVLLWASPDDAVRNALSTIGIGRIVAKPLSGAALTDILYPPANVTQDHLVSRAA